MLDVRVGLFIVCNTLIIGELGQDKEGGILPNEKCLGDPVVVIMVARLDEEAEKNSTSKLSRISLLAHRASSLAPS